jgi:hypothetical protein
MLTIENRNIYVRYKFYLYNENDAEIIDRFQNLSSYLRNDLTKNALRYYIGKHDIVENMLDDKTIKHLRKTKEAIQAIKNVKMKGVGMKVQKTMVKLYLQENNDRDLIERLGGLPAYMRNDLIKDALRYYIANVVEKGRVVGIVKSAKADKMDKFVDPIGKHKMSFEL